MVVIGITGPTGAGKTTALQQILALDGCVLDADAIYHRLLEKDHGLQEELTQRFGPLHDGMGHFDRKKLGQIVFQDSAALEDLNRIAHRYVLAEIRMELEDAGRSGCPVAAIDAIALFESGASALCQRTVAITAPESVRLQRIMKREGIPEAYASARIRAQQPETFFTSRCDYTLVNDEVPPEIFAAQSRQLFEQILQENKGGSPQ